MYVYVVGAVLDGGQTLTNKLTMDSPGMAVGYRCRISRRPLPSRLALTPMLADV